VALDLAHMTVRQFIDATAAAQPTPGGGSVAGVVGALGASLAEMALGFTRGKKAFAQHEADFAAIAGRLANARGAFGDLVADDAEAYTLFQQASQDTGPGKEAKVRLALAAAIDVPREMTVLALAVLDDVASLAGRCNRWLISDLAAGAVLADAVVRLCDYNVRINARSYADTAAADGIRQASARDVARAKALLERIELALQGQI
jgi:formiminotetrahydrofolate cyclodeaminase